MRKAKIYPSSYNLSAKKVVKASTSVSRDVEMAVEDELAESFEDNIVNKVASRIGVDNLEEAEMGINNYQSKKAKEVTDRYQRARQEYIEAVSDMMFLW